MDSRITGIRCRYQVSKRFHQQKCGCLVKSTSGSPRRGTAMNIDLYYGILGWITRGELPVRVTEQEKNIIIKRSEEFEVKHLQLRKKQGTLSLPVIKEGQTNKIIKLAHDHPLSGHMGQSNTYQRLHNVVWWPGMSGDIINYVRHCETCQK